jgi:hypothetical protein
MADVPDAREDTGTAPGGAETEAFDYAAPAELFTRRNPSAHIAAGTSPADADRARSRASHRKAIAYRRFASGAEAIRYAIEERDAQPGADNLPALSRAHLTSQPKA